MSLHEYEIGEGLNSNIACDLIDEEARNSKDGWLGRNELSEHATCQGMWVDDDAMYSSELACNPQESGQWVL